MVKLDLPKATSAADIQKPEKVEFAIDANGGLFWKGERITREDAIARFAEEGRKRPQPEVYLRADQNVPYRYVAETLADASKGGLPRSPSSANRRASGRIVLMSDRLGTQARPTRRVAWNLGIRRSAGRPHRPARSHPDRRSGSGGRRGSRRPP